MFSKINKNNYNPLVNAYKNNDIEKFRKLIKKGYSVDSIYGKHKSVNIFGNDHTNYYLEYSLIAAIIRNKKSFTNNKEFLNSMFSEDVYLGNFAQDPALLPLATRHSDIDCMKQLLDRGLCINESSLSINPAIFEAILSNDMEKIDFLLAHNPDLKITGSPSDTPILNYLFTNYYSSSLYSEISHYEIFDKLIKKGADPKQKDHFGMSYIHTWSLTIRNSNNELKKLFDYAIKKGCDVNEKCNCNRTPLIYAAKTGNLPAIEILVKNNAKISDRELNGMSAIHYAALENRYDIVEFLKENGAETSGVDVSGHNICHTAALYEKNFDFMLSFFEKYSYLMSNKDKYGKSPVDIFLKNNKLSSVQLKQLKQFQSKQKNNIGYIL